MPDYVDLLTGRYINTDIVFSLFFGIIPKGKRVQVRIIYICIGDFSVVSYTLTLQYQNLKVKFVR